MTTTTTRISIAEAITKYNDLTFIDASWYHKGDRNGRDEYLRGPRIAKAVYFDVSSTSNNNDDDNSCSNNYHNAQPSAQQFARIMDSLGITNQANIVVYGQAGTYFTPRVWFTIRHLMGHESCLLLDGTMADWVAAGGPLEDHTLHHQPHIQHEAKTVPCYQPKYNPNVLITLKEMKQFVGPDGPRGMIWDARGSSFTQQGHMPGAVHVPYSSLHDQHGRLLSTDQIASILRPHRQEATTDLVVTCGTGVSACTLFWALQELGWDQCCGGGGATEGSAVTPRVRVYDGSWSEWKMQDNVPKVMPSSSSSSA